MPAQKLRHIVEGSSYHEGTERSIVFAYCGVEEEAAGSGRHTLEAGDKPCERCLEMFTKTMSNDDFDEERP